MSMTMTRWVMTGFICGALLSMSASCGPQQCTPTTCTGCCDSSNRCQLGNQNSVCGSKGAACTSCSLGQACSFGGVCTGGSGGNNAGGGFATTGGGSAGGGFATGGGLSTGGGVATGGGFATGGGLATGGGTVTGGGLATGGGTANCSPANCLGCCLNNVCQNGNAALACGRAGNQCSVCSGGAVCNAFGMCSGSSGGGGAGGGSGGGAPACTTCLAQTGGTLACVPLANISVTTCGTNGSFCQNCVRNGFTACTNGVCTGSAAGGGSAGGGSATGGGNGGGTPISGIGSPCTNASQCTASLGSTAICKTQTNPTPGFAPSFFPQGFCTLPCSSSGESNCGAGNTCAGGTSSTLALYNETGRYCVNGCTMLGQCSSGLECTDISDATAATSAGGCWLNLNSTNATFTGGGLPTNLGGTCTNNAGCSNPPDPALGVCFGGTELPFMGFPGGQCFAYTGFAPDSYCVQANGMEVLLRTRADGGSDFWCGQACLSLGSSPRTGYRCTPVYFPDAGLKGGMVWRQACATNSDCANVTGATQCNTTYGQCCVTSSSPLTAQNCTGLGGL